ncbi:MAG TPA: hypothetical protein VHH14_02875, partial [Solirubrobacterales bacterium]|nr:hypothetical protein [Solirubrobacterales bacterium]
MNHFAKAFATVLALLTLLPAGASAYPLQGGSLEAGKTTFTFDRTIRRAMDAAGIEATPLAPARKTGRWAIRLPISEGMLEPRFGSGYAFQRGGIMLRAGGRSVALRRLILNTAKKRLTGAVAGHPIVVAKVDDVKGWRTDFGLAVRVKSVRLTEKAADIISARLRVDGVFRPHRSLGLAHVSGTLFTVPVTEGTIQLVLDQGFQQKLASLGVALSTTGEAAQTGVNVFQFPAVKGDVNRRLTHGGIGTTDDGLRFAQAGPSPREISWASIGLGFESGFGGEGS